mgnify:CR=1 FL=1
MFDTCALIEHPEILCGLAKHELAVVSKRVIDELDDKKLEADLRPQIARAVKHLQTLPDEQIRFEDGDMSLLSQDYRKKGDNLILSVAVRFRDHHPVLVTNDHDLAVKARAEGLKSMNAGEFGRRASGLQATNPSEVGEARSQQRQHDIHRRDKRGRSL